MQMSCANLLVIFPLSVKRETGVVSFSKCYHLKLCCCIIIVNNTRKLSVLNDLVANEITRSSIILNFMEYTECHNNEGDNAMRSL
jgi:hypothetical protein